MTSKLVTATKALHKIGDISSEEPDLAQVNKREGNFYVGSWVCGVGFFDVKFPIETTRPCTEEEKAYWLKGTFRSSFAPDFKLQEDEFATREWLEAL
jgi:uncharacterized cupin superfamily protein